MPAGTACRRIIRQASACVIGVVSIKKLAAFSRIILPPVVTLPIFR
jgi:hypothetical protein